jgi:hypothetical protein
MSSFSPALQLLQQQLLTARHQTATLKARNAEGQLIQVPGIGKTISSAYEQLRNAAEYTEEHLLLQRAIRRFYNRNISFFTEKRAIGRMGEELVVELTQAGYLDNNTISQDTAKRITQLVEHYLQTYHELRANHISRDEASEWVLDLMSVETEEHLNPHAELNAFAYFAYDHFLQLFPRERLARTPEELEKYEITLYIGVHQAMLKSDSANVRYDLMRMYGQTPHNMPAFIEFNRNVSALHTAKLTQKLKRMVSKYGAPLCVLKRLIEDRPDVPELLQNREMFMAVYTQQVSKEYKDVKRRLNKGIIKSIIFLFITKVIIGVGVEVPYDIFVHGSVVLLPLAINLLFPPLYMASLKLGLRPPSLANAEALGEYIDGVLYANTLPPQSSLRLGDHKVSGFTKLLTVLLFLVPFGILISLLAALQFNIVQGLIFVIFMSTASFLGFRLSRMVRELEIVTKQTSILASLRDFFYLPFILFGQWLSNKYSKVNAVGIILDLAIELPLKTVLRLFRQWTRFLSDKHDDIY